MKKVIKTGDNIGICNLVQGKVVDVQPHPKYKDLFVFTYDGQIYHCSEYAFKE